MSAWGGPPSSGAWANQVDEEEEANGGELDPVPGVSTAFPVLGDNQYPTLGDSIHIRETKKERKKKQVQKMSLGNFMAAGKEPEKIDLPTRPRERAEGEEDKRGGLGGGFKNYGGDRGGFGDRDDEGGFRGREEVGPSRADAADDWGTKKAFVPSGPSRGGFGSGGFGERSGGFRDRDSGGGFSDRYTERKAGFTDGDPFRADAADKWASKTFEPSSTSQRGGGGFETRDRERYGGFRDDNFGSSKADSEDRWSRRPETSSQPSGPPSGSRPRLNLQPRSADLPVPELPPPSTSSAPKTVEESSDDGPRELSLPSNRAAARSNPFGDAKPVAVKEVQEKEPGQPTSEVQDDQAETSAPADIPNSPAIQQQNKPKANPFGSARPREEVLREKAVQQPQEEQQKEPEASTSVTESSGAAETPAVEIDAPTLTQNEPLQQQDLEEKVPGSSSQSKGSEPERVDKAPQTVEEPTPNKSSNQPETIVEKAKENAKAAVEKVTTALSDLTTKDEAKQENGETSVAETASEEKAKAETPQIQTPKSPAERPKSSEVRPGASWANIARGPPTTSAPVDSN